VSGIRPLLSCWFRSTRPSDNRASTASVCTFSAAQLSGVRPHSSWGAKKISVGGRKRPPLFWLLARLFPNGVTIRGRLRELRGTNQSRAIIPSSHPPNTGCPAPRLNHGATNGAEIAPKHLRHGNDLLREASLLLYCSNALTNVWLGSTRHRPFPGGG